jgi:hypothetical protein
MNKIIINDENGEIQDLVFRNLVNAITYEEMTSIKNFIMDKNLNKEFTKEVLGERIYNNKTLRYQIFDIIASINKKTYAYPYIRFKKITSIALRVPNIDNSEYVIVEVNFKGNKYAAFSDMLFNEKIEWDFNKKDMKKEMVELINKHIDEEKYFLKNFIFESELILDRDYEEIISLPKKDRGFKIKNAKEVINTKGLFGFSLEYCDFFENNSKNRKIIIDRIMRDGIHREIVGYTFSKNDLIKYVLPSFKIRPSKSSAFFNLNIYKDSEKVAIAIKILEEQKKVDAEVVEKYAIELSYLKGFKEKLKKSKIVLEKIKNNSRVQLLVLLQ